MAAVMAQNTTNQGVKHMEVIRRIGRERDVQLDIRLRDRDFIRDDLVRYSPEYISASGCPPGYIFDI